MWRCDLNDTHHWSGYVFVPLRIAQCRPQPIFCELPDVMDKLTILTMDLGFMPRGVGARQRQEAGHFARLMAMGVAFYTVVMGAIAMISLLIQI